MAHNQQSDGLVDRDEHIDWWLQILKKMGATAMQCKLWREGLQQSFPEKCEPFQVILW